MYPTHISLDDVKKHDPPKQSLTLDINTYAQNNSCRKLPVKYADSSAVVHCNPVSNRIIPNGTSNPTMTPYDFFIERQQPLMILYPQSIACLMPPVMPTQVISPRPALTEFRFDEHTSTLYWRNIKAKDGIMEVRLANFEIAVLKVYRLINLDDEDIFIDIGISGNSGNPRKILSLPRSQLCNLYAKIEKEYPEFILYPDCRKNKELFKQYVAEVYNCDDRDNRIEIIYSTSGWHERADGWHYFSANDSDCLGKMTLPPPLDFQTTLDAIHWCAGLLSLSEEEIMLPLIIHAHLGFTLKLFEEAGFREQFILTIIGPSGSKKTSLARVLFCLFGNDLSNFTFTDRAIELEIIEHQDSTLVIDDMTSGRDAKQASTFERILRQLGDSTGRKKSTNGGAQLERNLTRCAVVVTAESDIDALGKSSKLRTLAVRLNTNSIDSDKLLEYQRDELFAKQARRFNRLELYIGSYIHFLENNFPQAVSDIINRKLLPANNFHFARQETIFKILASQAELILTFWETCGAITPEEHAEIFARWDSILRDVMQANEQRGKVVDPCVLFLRFLNDAAIPENLIAQNKQTFEQQPAHANFIGYAHEQILMLLPDLSYANAINFFTENRLPFNETAGGLWNRLYEIGLLEVYTQKDHKPKLLKQVKINGSSMSFVALNTVAANFLLHSMDF